MANNKIKKITLEDFINKSKDKYKNKKVEADVEIDGDLIPFTRPSNGQYLTYMNALANSVKADKEGNLLETDLENMTQASAELIFNACHFVRNKELQDSLEIKDPLDTPAEVFGIDNLNDIATSILEAFGMGDKNKNIKEEIKN